MGTNRGAGGVGVGFPVGCNRLGALAGFGGGQDTSGGSAGVGIVAACNKQAFTGVSSFRRRDFGGIRVRVVIIFASGWHVLSGGGRWRQEAERLQRIQMMEDDGDDGTADDEMSGSVVTSHGNGCCSGEDRV